MSDFNPQRLRLARELRETSQASLADALGVSAAAVSQFETGALVPNPSAQAKMVELLDVPRAWFTTPSCAMPLEGFFRSLRRTPASKRRRARAAAETLYEMAMSAPTDVLPPVRLPDLSRLDLQAADDDVERMAGEVRAQWGMPSGPIPNVLSILEAHGVLVGRSTLTSVDVDAFSIPFPGRPVVILGRDKNDRARSRFDASHELGHLVLHGQDVWGLPEVEHQANVFAAAFLMPASDIGHELPDTIDWEQLFALKRRWQTSLAALVRRMKTLRRINDHQYTAAMKTMSARGWRRVEPVPLGACEETSLLYSLLAALPPTLLAAHPKDFLTHMT